MESKAHGLPEIDQIIASALQINGRASWEALSRVIDLPSRTVMRRGQTLLETNKVRVSTFVDASRLLHARGVLIRLRAEIRQVSAVAQSLASLPDASSVSILEGAGDIAALVLVKDSDAHQDLLLSVLPCIPGVQSFEVSTVLRSYNMGLDWHAGILPCDQVEALRKGLPRHSNLRDNAPVELDDVDRKLIDLLNEDGRASYSMLADGVQINSQTVRRRLEALFEVGVLRVRTEVDPTFFDFKVEALLWLHINNGDVESVGSLLAANPNVRYCAAMTGHAGLLIDALFENEEGLFDFQNDVLGSLPTVEIAESRVVLKPVKRGPLLVDKRAEP